MIVARAIAVIENHMDTRTMPSRVGRDSLQVQASQFWYRYRYEVRDYCPPLSEERIAQNAGK